MSQIAGGGGLKNKYNCSSDGGLWADEKWSTPDDAGIVGGEGRGSKYGWKSGTQNVTDRQKETRADGEGKQFL